MATTREQAQVSREAKLDELHERLTAAVENLASGEDWARALAFAARFRARSFSNTLLIWEQQQGAYEAGLVPEPFPSYVAGFKQWQGLARQVQKGQPGYQILAPITGRFASANPTAAASWRRLGKGEKPRAGEVARSMMVGVRPAYVWDASQTAGDAIPEPPSSSSKTTTPSTASPASRSTCSSTARSRPSPSAHKDGRRSLELKPVMSLV